MEILRHTNCAILDPMQGTWARLQFFMTILPLLWVELIQASTPYKVPPPDFPCWSPLGLCFDQHTFSSLSWADTEIPAPFIPVGPGLPVGRQLYPHSDVFSLSFLAPGYFLLFILIFFFYDKNGLIWTTYCVVKIILFEFAFGVWQVILICLPTPFLT